VGARAAALGAGGVQPGGKAPGPAAHIDGSGVPSAGSVSKQPEREVCAGREVCPGH
jgi:hypothetical protein